MRHSADNKQLAVFGRTEIKMNNEKKVYIPLHLERLELGKEDAITTSPIELPIIPASVSAEDLFDF